MQVLKLNASVNQVYPNVTSCHCIDLPTGRLFTGTARYFGVKFQHPRQVSCPSSVWLCFCIAATDRRTKVYTVYIDHDRNVFHEAKGFNFKHRVIFAWHGFLSLYFEGHLCNTPAAHQHEGNSACIVSHCFRSCSTLTPIYRVG